MEHNIYCSLRFIWRWWWKWRSPIRIIKWQIIYSFCTINKPKWIVLHATTLHYNWSTQILRQYWRIFLSSNFICDVKSILHHIASTKSETTELYWRNILKSVEGVVINLQPLLRLLGVESWPFPFSVLWNPSSCSFHPIFGIFFKPRGYHLHNMQTHTVNG
jgi:hypothetical protein